MLKNRVARKKFLLERYKNIFCSCCTLKLTLCHACGRHFKVDEPIICIEDEVEDHFIKHYCFECVDPAFAVKEQRGVPCKQSPLDQDIGSSEIIERKNQGSKQGIDTENVEEK